MIVVVVTMMISLMTEMVIRATISSINDADVIVTVVIAVVAVAVSTSNYRVTTDGRRSTIKVKVIANSMRKISRQYSGG